MRRIAFALLVSSLAACQGKAKVDKATTAAENPGASEGAGPFVMGYNKIIEAVPKYTFQAYFRLVPEATSSFRKARSLFDPFVAKGAMDGAKAAFATGKQAGTDAARRLAPLSDELVAASEQLVAIYGEARKYYDEENFKDDNGQKGAELHAQMIVARDKYGAAVRKIDAELSAIEDARTAAQLGKLGKDKYGYWFRYFNAEAKKLVDSTDSWDAATFATRFATLEKAHQELTQFTVGRGAGIDSSFKNYQEDADDLFAIAKRLSRLAADGKARPDKIEDEVHSLVREYNFIVDQFNRLAEYEADGRLQ